MEVLRAKDEEYDRVGGREKERREMFWCLDGDCR